MDLLMGFAQRDITPPVGVELCGHGFYCQRKSSGVLEPIHARALSWACGHLRGAIIELEVLCVPGRRARKIKELVSVNSGIPADRIMIACLHTHSAPCTCDMMGYGEPNEEYIAELICRSAGAALDACGRMRPVTLEYASVPAEGIGRNRERPGGATDPELRVLRVMNDGKLTAFIANYACHPVVLNRGTFLVSGDFIGIALNAVCRAHDLQGMFLQGACGDINSRYVNCPQKESLPQVRELSTQFAALIEEALFSSPAEQIAVEQVMMETRTVDLPLQRPDRLLMGRHLRLVRSLAPYFDRLPPGIRKDLVFEKESCEAIWESMERGECDRLETEMQALRWGRFIIAAQPAELFYKYQAEMFRAFGEYRLMMAGYANDYVGYVPDEGQYETAGAAAEWVPYVLRLPPFRRDIGEVFTRHLIETVRAVAG